MKIEHLHQVEMTVGVSRCCGVRSEREDCSVSKALVSDVDSVVGTEQLSVDFIHTSELVTEEAWFVVDSFLCMGGKSTSLLCLT